jgi:glutamate racemase
MKIGVFDSGVGGKFIADKLQSDFPEQRVIYVDDRKHVPYGSRTNDDVTRLTELAIQPLLSAECNVIVVACNTATAAAIDYLRSKYPKTPFIGLEPMVKPAASLTKSKTIAICATPSTLASGRYDALKKQYASNITILEPDCSTWANMIEYSEIDDQTIFNTIDTVCGNGADVIVLACTHYHWIKEKILKIANNRAIVIDPSDSISERVRSILFIAQQAIHS